MLNLERNIATSDKLYANMRSMRALKFEVKAKAMLLAKPPFTVTFGQQEDPKVGYVV